MTGNGEMKAVIIGRAEAGENEAPSCESIAELGGATKGGKSGYPAQTVERRKTDTRSSEKIIISKNIEHVKI